MKIAIPIWNQRISPLLDTASRLLVLTCRDRKEVNRLELPIEPQPIEELAATLAALKLDLLLCGAVTRPLLKALENHGVSVHPHLCGEIGEILEALCHGQLNEKHFQIPGCGEISSKPDRPLVFRMKRRSHPKSPR